MLTTVDGKQEYALVRNVTSLGHSEINDVVLKTDQIALKHAKIIRVGGQYKAQNLSGLEGTFVNNRRIEQRFLRDGDEISIGNYKFKFSIGKNTSNKKHDKS